MCKSALHPFLAALPKCELHLHLEGTLSPTFEFELAQKNNIILPQDDPAFASPEALLERYSHFSDLDDFLHYYLIGMTVLQYASDFEDLAMKYFIKASSDGVRHAEVFFDPEAHTSRGVPYETVVKGFRTACQRAEKELSISTKLIICVLRSFPVQSAQDTYDTAVRLGHFTDGTLGGLGISDTEIGQPTLKWEGIFTAAKDAGIRRTAHAGEEGPAEYIRGALDFLHAERIDHGKSLADDPELMKRVVEEKILITMCPVSNVRTRVIGSVGEAPIREFLDAGVRFCINSDDPAYFGSYILDTYCAVQDAFELGVREWELITENSIEGSWCDERRKEKLHIALKQCVEKFNG
jgi:adenosine deaminase